MKIKVISKYELINKIIYVTILIILNLILLISFTRVLDNNEVLFAFSSLILEPICNHLSITFYNIIQNIIIIITLITLLICFIVYRFYKVKGVMRLGINLIIILLMSTFILFTFKRGEIINNYKVNGKLIVKSIDNFYDRNKKLPASLNDLITLDATLNSIPALKDSYMYRPTYPNSLGIYDYDLYIVAKNLKSTYKYNQQIQNFDFVD